MHDRKKYWRWVYSTRAYSRGSPPAETQQRCQERCPAAAAAAAMVAAEKPEKEEQAQMKDHDDEQSGGGGAEERGRGGTEERIGCGYREECQHPDCANCSVLRKRVV
jgi:hypothetical protein